MKKTALFSLLIAASIVACNKSDKKNTTPVSKPISTDSVQTLSDSLKVNYYKTSTKGTLPDAKGGTITLENQEDTVIAVNGRYVIVTPQITGAEENVAGYYVRIKGANTYYTVDYTMPITRKKPVHAGLMSRIQSPRDSIIALKLPVNLLPGTFTVEYEAYDADGNVSNMATSIVSVIANDQTSAEVKLLQGTWSWGGYGYVRGTDTMKYTFPYADSSISTYACSEDNMLISSEEGTEYITDYSYYAFDRETFNTNNSVSEEWSYLDLNINLDKSRCGAPAYDTTASPDSNSGSYAYNAKTKQLYFIYDYNGTNSGNFDVWVTYDVTITANKITFNQSETTTGDYYYYDYLVK